jgi:hypothetical protein
MSTALAHTAHDIRSRALSWLHAHHPMGALEGDGLGGKAETYKALQETALAASLILRDGAAGSAEYAHFARVGYRHPGVERLIPHIAAMGTVKAVEHVPNRRLAVANALRITGHDHGVSTSDWETLTRATWLGGNPEPWHIDWMTGYSVTHTVFHLTDWGSHPEWLPDDVVAYLVRWLPVWIDVWVESCQWDLVGELLIVGSCLPEPYGEITDWQRLADLQHADGLMPRDDQPVDDDLATRFRDHQHPTIVATIAGTVALTRALDTPTLEAS